MNDMEISTIGERIKTLRKKRGYNQKELADLLGKSLRTIQKYESGEIEVSIAMVNELAKVLDTTSTYLLGHQTGDFKFDSLSDVMECLFQIEKITGLHFSIETKDRLTMTAGSVPLPLTEKIKQLIRMQICAFSWKNGKTIENLSKNTACQNLPMRRGKIRHWLIMLHRV